MAPPHTVAMEFAIISLVVSARVITKTEPPWLVDPAPPLQRRPRGVRWRLCANAVKFGCLERIGAGKRLKGPETLQPGLTS